MQYLTYEMAHSVLSPIRIWNKVAREMVSWPLHPFAGLPVVKSFVAASDVFEQITRRYGKPAWGIEHTSLHGLQVPVRTEVACRRPFCELLHFVRDEQVVGKRSDPRILIVAPMSGHYATLLRGTVEAMLPEHDVYITDWVDARDVPIYLGRFDLDDYIQTIIEFLQFLGPDTHIIAVCQPSVPTLAATAVMAARNDPCQPLSMTLMGGPIDTRRNETQVNKLAREKPIEWFERNVIAHVPPGNAGFMRRVYPGFIQLTGFMTMNLERHVNAHIDLFNHLVAGDHDSAAQHRAFYEEYLAVMDLPAEFYLQTVKTVFQDHDLPDGRMMHRGEPVDCSAIRNTALMTVEGERDDICGLGQTEAAHDLCTDIPIDERYHYVQAGVGHYGVFNGRRWRTEIQPRIREMIRTIQFKRRTRTGAMALPYRKLSDDRERQFDWRAPPSSG